MLLSLDKSISLQQSEIGERWIEGAAVNGQFERHHGHLIGSVVGINTGLRAWWLCVTDSDALTVLDVLIRVPESFEGQCAVPDQCQAVLKMSTPTGSAIQDHAAGRILVRSIEKGRIAVEAELQFGDDEDQESATSLPWCLHLREATLEPRQGLVESWLYGLVAERSETLRSWRGE